MNELCQIIKEMVIPNFINMETSIKTYDRNADCCGAPAWRFVYHALFPYTRLELILRQFRHLSFHTCLICQLFFHFVKSVVNIASFVFLIFPLKVN